MLAVELYWRTPFGRIHMGNPEIVSLAGALDRTPGSIALKMSNLAALDPTLKQRGMSGYSKLDADVWAEFFASPSDFLDRLERMTNLDFNSDLTPRKLSVREGVDVERLVKVRRHQDFFRKTLLASYNGRCAVTGIAQTELLIASHIVPWAENSKLRLNPQNGILLNALHDRAFDQHLITFDRDYRMIVAPGLEVAGRVAEMFEGKRLRLPERSHPAPELLKHHRDVFAEKWAA